MNIQMQLCGAVILILLLYFILRQKSVGLFSERVFLGSLVVNLICISLDILSIVVIVNHESLPNLLVVTICKAYIVSLTWVGFCGLIYASLDMDDKIIFRKKTIRYASVLVIGTVMIAVLPIHYYVEERVVYTYGPSVLMTYIIAVGFVFFTLYRTYVDRTKMNYTRKKAIRTWMLIWIIAAAIQFLNNRLLLVGFASCVGMMILFFELENPEARQDRNTDAFNAHAFLDYMRQEYDRHNERFSLLMISLVGNQPYIKTETDMTEAFKKMVVYLKTFSEIKVFKNVEQELIMVFPNVSALYRLFPLIQKRFQEPWVLKNIENRSHDVYIYPSFLLMPDHTVAKSAEDIFRLFHYFRVENIRSAEQCNICYIDRNLVEQMHEQERIEHMILDAIKEDRIEVFYQPIYSTKKKKFVSAEALVRIRKHDGGFLPPSEFVGVAEETGLIDQLGKIVFEKTCCLLKEKELWNLGIEYIEVNLSVRQCEEQNLAYSYMDIITKYGIPPSAINLEITETASIHAKKVLLENMNVLIDFGVHFSLDDFGSGESNLNYIVDMPVSIVKFDRDMSQAYFQNSKAKFVMEAAMHMIHDMHLKIVSEGVETKEQMEKITALGIEYIQGFYFSRPLRTNDFLEFIRRENAIGE